MLNLLPDGTITIEFPEPTGLVTIQPPKWGAYKRIRRERERIQEALLEKVAELDTLDAMPATDDNSEEAKEKRKELSPKYRARRHEIEALTSDSLGETWRFMLLGNRKPAQDDGAGTGTMTAPSGDFDGLAVTPRPPEDLDDWPTELFIDAADLEIGLGGAVIRTNETLLDQVHKHWGKARFRSGSTPAET